MKVREARDLVLSLIDAAPPAPAVRLDPRPPAGDPGTFTLQERAARVIHHFSGWMVPINRGWFEGGFDPPEINGFSFYWYAFALPGRHGRRDHYFVCDYLQMRDWVLDFDAPLGRDYREQRFWRADVRVYRDDGTEKTGYFRWGDEPVGADPRPNRVITLDNVATVAEPAPLGLHVGSFGHGGESAAHHRLKLYVAAHPGEFGLDPRAEPSVEYQFVTGDRVDVMFENHRPFRTVVEVEVVGEQNVCVGIHQAIKYRSLAEVDGAYAPLTPAVRSLVVAYDVNYRRARDLAERYDVQLIGVDRHRVLAVAS